MLKLHIWKSDLCSSFFIDWKANLMKTNTQLLFHVGGKFIPVTSPWESENNKCLPLRCFPSIHVKLYLIVFSKNCLCGRSLLKMHGFGTLSKHASFSFSAPWHKSPRRQETPQDKLLNIKNSKMLACFKRHLPNIYQMASFATGSLLVLSLKLLREVSETVTGVSPR